MKARAPSKTAERAQEYLVSEGRARSLGDICQAIGLRRTSSHKLGLVLRRHYSEKLFEEKINGVVYLSMPGVKPAPGAVRRERRMHQAKDLWRGWYNPATGITGAALGLVGYE